MKQSWFFKKRNKENPLAKLTKKKKSKTTYK